MRQQGANESSKMILNGPSRIEAVVFRVVDGAKMPVDRINARTGAKRGLNMSTLIESKALSDASWEAWVTKGRMKEKRRNAAYLRLAKWVPAVALLAAAGLWSYLAPYDIALRFIASVGAIVAMFQAWYARHYIFAAVFAALVLLYNPLMPAFHFSGDWQRALVALSVMPFLGSLAWVDKRPIEHA